MGGVAVGVTVGVGVWADVRAAFAATRANCNSMTIPRRLVGDDLNIEAF